jgi:peptide/nickel transport system substrate-binding protein
MACMGMTAGPLVAVAWLLWSNPAVAEGVEKSELVGTLESATIITDPAQIPKTFHEAPMLNALVREGKLPPVERRVPSEPMVIRPVHEIGKYGGTWRRAFIGPSDSENGNRLRAADKPLFFDMTGTQEVPDVAKAWEVSPDGRKITLSLRKGMRWSDGVPFTADDFIFWYEDMYQNEELVPSGAPELSVDGKPDRISKADDTTIVFDFDAPYYLFPAMLAGDTFVGGGPSRHQEEGRAFGLYAPAHYLK